MENCESLKLENQLCFPLYAAAREVIRQYTPLLSRYDLTYTQYITMMVLWHTDQISVHDLGRKLYLDSGTLTPLLKSLEKKGYISRKRSSQDERVVLVQASEKGIELAGQLKDVPAEIAGCISLQPQEAMELYRLLYKILEQLN